ncbi:MlaD family protein [Thermophagus sp. OGC60D27]|uniref:MlaD family protein n=1 Tax=Thermophagus sp. OGC60D27 TaxID=3458415 RepID=UPI004037EB8A
MKKEYKIAITVISALILLIWGLNFLKGKDLFSTGTTFYCVYPDLEGITKASPVYYHGYKVGSVRDIEFYPEREEKFIITLSLEKDLPVYKSTVAQIYSFDIMGTMAIQLLDGPRDAMLTPGDTLQTSIKEGIFDQVTTTVMPIKDKVESLMVKIDSAISGLVNVLSESNNQSLSEGMNSFAQTMKNLENISEQMKRAVADGGALQNSMANLDTLSGTLAQQKESIATTIDNAAAFSGELKRLNINGLAERMDSSLTILNDMLAQARDGDGSLGMLLSDEGLYYNLLDASANLNRLLEDVRENPRRYLKISAIDFGKEINIKVDDEQAKNAQITYKVKVAESDKPLEIKNQMIRSKYRIMENKDGKKYTYTVGETSSYQEIKGIYDQVISLYPQSQIMAFKKGKAIRLIRALKLSQEKN